MVKKDQTIQWSRKIRQYNGQGPLYCLIFLDHCIVRSFLNIVLSDLSWPLYCLIFLDHYIVWSCLTIVLSDLSWPLNCLIFLDHCIGWSFSDNTMVKKDQTIQWSRKIRQYNGQERSDNTMVKKDQTIQWPWSYGCWIYNYKSVHSVIITTKIVSLDPVHDEMYSIGYVVIKFVSDVRQVGDFLIGSK
jgi:hypothetical protein